MGREPMAESSFEQDLTRLYGETPPMADARAFADRVETRLERGYRLRRAVVGILGVAGGLLAVGQLAGQNLLAHVQTLGQASVRAQAGASALAHAAAVQAPVLQNLPVGIESLWFVAALVALAGAALVATRVMEEL
jgi:hypothetical protein